MARWIRSEPAPTLWEGERLTSIRDNKIMIEKARNFLKDVVVEMGKVSWPTRDELIGSTIVVIISVIIATAVIGIFDFIFSTAVHLVIR